MAEICVGSASGSTESSTAVAVLGEGSSRAARRRRIEIRRRRFVADAGLMAPASATSPGRKRPAGDADSSSDSTPNTRSRSNTPPPPQAAAATVPAYGVTSIIGRRRDMEDAVAIQPDFLPGGGCHFFGVFDGHGCSHVATSCKKWMHETVAEEVGSVGLPKAEQTELWKEVMERSFARVDADVIGIPSCSGGTATCRCELQTPKCEHVGSTAVVAVVGPDVIVVANAGDSRAVLCRNGAVVPLSEDHKPDRPDELQRIEEAGGRVIYWDGARVLGVLAMSRAIGDGYLKPFVTAEPEVTVTKREEGDECLILASDGLWDVVTNEMACYIVKMCLRGSQAATDDMAGSKKACSDAAVLLTKLAMARGSTDNISVVVVDVRNNNL